MKLFILIISSIANAQTIDFGATTATLLKNNNTPILERIYPKIKFAAATGDSSIRVPKNFCLAAIQTRLISQGYTVAVNASRNIIDGCVISWP